MRGNITRRGKSSWRIKTELRPHPQTGERRYHLETVRGTKRDAEARLLEVLGNIRDHSYVKPSKVTVGAFVDTWLTVTMPGQVAPKTLERYADLLRGHVVPAIGSTPLQQLGAHDIEELYRDLRASGRRRGDGGLSARTVLHVHRALGQVLKSAVRKRLLERSPMDDVEATPKAQQREVEILTDAQLATLLRHLKGGRLYMPVLLAASTGMRRGEVLGLRWSDIDFDRAQLTVRQSLEETRDGLRVKEPKTPQSRRQIALPASVVEALRAHRARQAEERLAIGLGKADDGLVFVNPVFGPIVPRHLTKSFARAVAAAKLPPVTFHGLRHTHITHLLREGVPVKVVSERAGHANISITLQIYAHVLPNMQTDAAAIMDASLRAAMAETAS